VDTEPPIDLISKLIPLYCLAWHSLNKAVSLSLKWHRPDSVAIGKSEQHARKASHSGSKQQ